MVLKTPLCATETAFMGFDKWMATPLPTWTIQLITIGCQK